MRDRILNVSYVPLTVNISLLIPLCTSGRHSSLYLRLDIF